MFINRLALAKAGNASALAARNMQHQQRRGYFSVFDKLKDRFSSPLRHI
jgi:hypothetical protein